MTAPKTSMPTTRWLAAFCFLLPLAGCLSLEGAAERGPATVAPYYVATGVTSIAIPFGYFHGAGFIFHATETRFRPSETDECPNPPENFRVIALDQAQCDPFVEALERSIIVRTPIFASWENEIILINDNRYGYRTWWLSRKVRKLEIPAYTGWDEGWIEGGLSVYAHEAMHFVFRQRYQRARPRWSSAQSEVASEGIAELAEIVCVRPSGGQDPMSRGELAEALHAAFAGVTRRSAFEASGKVQESLRRHLGTRAEPSVEACDRLFAAPLPEGPGTPPDAFLLSLVDDLTPPRARS